jgi:DNA adenine methylase
LNSIISCRRQKGPRELTISVCEEFGRYIEVFGGGGWCQFGRPQTPLWRLYDFIQTWQIWSASSAIVPLLLQGANFFRCTDATNSCPDKNIWRSRIHKRVPAERTGSRAEFSKCTAVEEITQILLEKAQMNDVKRAAPFKGLFLKLRKRLHQL